MMDLRILLPEKTFWYGKVNKVVGEALDGSFALLPRHIDFVTIMVPGIFFALTEQNKDLYLAIDEGILIKQDNQLTLSTRKAIKGKDLGRLKDEVEEKFLKIDEQEEEAQKVLNKLEADFVRRFLDLEGNG